MKSIEEMIKEINIESLEKTINMLSGLQIFYKSIIKVYKEKKEPEQSIEKQIFELIKDNVFVDLNLNVLNFEMFQEMYTENSGYSILFRNYLFLAIMKSVHQLIENENFRLKWDTEYYTFRNDDLKNTFAVCIINVKKIMVKNNKTQHPDYFYFSTEKNAEKASDILSNFFGINLLNWWYK